ncbi:MFS transporter [Intrasporangium sp.]|uniref:MFS transporter n=1 Tax=Intrasporangium sp. TaxID=1925024 RepID=UPI003221E009
MPAADPADPVDATARSSHLIDLTPLRVSPAFARLWAGNTLSGIGAVMTNIAVALHIYDLTQSTFMVSLVAWFSLVPMVAAGLYGGAIADRFDRRAVALIASVVAWFSTVCLATVAWGRFEAVWAFYVITTVNAVAATVASATRQAITPRLLPVVLLPQAAALNGISMGVMVTLGPAVAGLLVARVGYPWTYTTDVILFVFGFLGLWTLPSIQPERAPDGHLVHGIEAVRHGLRYLRDAPNIRMSFVVDIVAMTFGQPIVLFPAVGAIVLGGGAMTVGLLTAAYAVGGIASSLLSGRLTAIRRQGRAIRTAIASYGLAIAGLGVVLGVTTLGGWSVRSPDFADVSVPGLAASCLCLVWAGASDNVSMIFRTTILQAAVPDAIRGRIQGISTVVVTGGPRLGQMFAGTLAAVTVTWLPPFAGGLLVVAVVWVWVGRVPSFRDYDALDPRP